MTKIYLKSGDNVLFAERPTLTQTCFNKDDIKSFLESAEQERKLGRQVFGFLSYEASEAFDERHSIIANKETPLAFFASFDKVQTLEKLPQASTPLNKVNVNPLINRDEYTQAIEKSLNYIKSGDIYQVNYTFRCELELNNDPEQFFFHLINNHPVPYSAYIEHEDLKVISLSPELFLSKRGNTLTTKPMKGTAKRSAIWEKDEKRRKELSQCEKGRSENIMIVDLMRNDLSRICTNVRTQDLFQVTRYPSLHQMTGTVLGDLKRDYSLFETLDATYPPGSIIGAPKIRAMEIIKELESSPRGIYTGSIFHLQENGDFDFNVCIRTIEIQKEKTLLGIGSGIVADSGSGPEWEECLLKSSFLNFPPPPDEVFSSLLHTSSEGFRDLELHLNRLKRSCRWLCRKFSKKEIKEKLHALNLNDSYTRVRIAIKLSGEISIQTQKIRKPSWDQLNICLYTAEKIRPKNPYNFHKTSKRDIYDRAFEYAQKEGFDEALIINNKDQVCEGSISAIKIIDKNNRLVLPHIKSGLLPSTLVSKILKNEKHIRKRITLDDLRQAKEVYMGNSIRSWGKVKSLKISQKETLLF